MDKSLSEILGCKKCSFLANTPKIYWSKDICSSLEYTNKDQNVCKLFNEIKEKVICEFFDVCNENTKSYCKDYDSLESSKAYCTIKTERINNRIFKPTIISFEIKATESGAKSLIKRVNKFLRNETNWSYKNLKYNQK